MYSSPHFLATSRALSPTLFSRVILALWDGRGEEREGMEGKESGGEGGEESGGKEREGMGRRVGKGREGKIQSGREGEGMEEG